MERSSRHDGVRTFQPWFSICCAIRKPCQSNTETRLMNPASDTYRASTMSLSHCTLLCFVDASLDEDCVQTRCVCWLAESDALQRLMALRNACQNWLHVPVLAPPRHSSNSVYSWLSCSHVEMLL